MVLWGEIPNLSDCKIVAVELCSFDCYTIAVVVFYYDN